MSDEDCKQCLSGIGRIEGSLTSLNSSIMKIVYAMLALIGANIGTKYIGTPIHVEIAMYSAVFSGIFVLLITIAKWHCLTFWEKWIRFSFILYVFYAFGLRVHHYQTGSPFTQTEGIVTNILMVSLAWGFIILAWNRDAKMRKHKRRFNDV